MSAVAVASVVSGVADGPVVVLSNSLGATHRMWDQNVAELERHFRVVRYDTRGHGASPVPAGPYTIDDLADDAIALLDRLGLARAHFVGLSLGGMTGMRLAARNPERVDRLAVLCTSAYLGAASAWRERAATVRAQGTGAVAEAVVTRWFTAGFRAANPTLRVAAEATVAATPPEGYAACSEAIAALDLRADLPQIAAPTLALAGDSDPATPPPHLEAIAGGVRNGRLVVVEDAAHLANAEQPAGVNAVLLEHLGAAV